MGGFAERGKARCGGLAPRRVVRRRCGPDRRLAESERQTDRRRMCRLLFLLILGLRSSSTLARPSFFLLSETFFWATGRCTRRFVLSWPWIFPSSLQKHNSPAKPLGAAGLWRPQLREKRIRTPPEGVPGHLPQPRSLRRPLLAWIRLVDRTWVWIHRALDGSLPTPQGGPRPACAPGGLIQVVSRGGRGGRRSGRDGRRTGFPRACG